MGESFKDILKITKDEVSLLILFYRVKICRMRNLLPQPFLSTQFSGIRSLRDCSAPTTAVRPQNFCCPAKLKLCPPSPLPQALAITVLFSVPVSLTIRGTSREQGHTESVLCDWLISLSITASGFIHVVAGVRISFLFQDEYHSNVLYTTCIHLYINTPQFACPLTHL